jgi:hypothetical protein
MAADAAPGGVQGTGLTVALLSFETIDDHLLCFQPIQYDPFGIWRHRSSQAE